MKWQSFAHQHSPHPAPSQRLRPSTLGQCFVAFFPFPSEVLGLSAQSLPNVYILLRLIMVKELYK